MQLAEIQQLQNLLDIAHSYIKINIPRLRKQGITWKRLTEVTGLDSTRLQRICRGELGNTAPRFLIRACSGLYEYLKHPLIKK